MPVTAGVAMLAVTITNEYGWYPRTSQSLPDGLTVALTVEDTAFYRPWTYAKPFVSRFLAVDEASVQTHDALPDQRIADVYAFQRWTAPSRVSVAIDCAEGRRAEIAEGTTVSEDGSLQGVPWRDVPMDDPVLTVVCRGG
jgi:hypothetical protein